jgi:cytochrome P450
MTAPHSYELYGPEFKRRAYQTYAEMRKSDPVYLHVFPDGFRMWFITGYEEVETILRDHKRFVKNLRNAWPPERVATLPESSPLEELLNNHMLNIDPPDHTRLRALINKAFTSRMINQMQGRVQQIAEELLDQVQTRGHMELIDEYAFPLPIVVIAELLGAPSADRDRFRVWSDAFIGEPESQEEAGQMMKLMADFTDYLRALFDERRARPQDDLISALIEAEEAGDKLSEAELFSMVILLIVAGHETTVNLIGNGVLALLQHPDQMAALRAEPALMPAAVEEFLRYDGPVERSTPRWATEDIELGGQTICRGDMVMVVLSAANRDEAQFNEAAGLDIHRENNKHMAFGLGIHYCVGAPLARMEGRIALDALLRRLPNLRLAGSFDELVWRTVPLIRGLKQLPVAWEVEA